MAYTSIIPVRCLDRAVDYVRDKTKTTRGPKSLQDAVDYAINREKTELDCFETGLSCVCETAFEDMRDTVQRWQQTAGVQGYHLVQSFAEGEVTPELAHQIGVELAEQLLQGRFQTVVTTHLNTKHYHNHIVWCSVALDNGRKYHSNAKSYYTEVRARSDALCRKYGLSIIETKESEQSSMPYHVWLDEQENRPNWTSMVRQDVDEAISQALTWRQFLQCLSQKGYTFRFNRKYPTLKPPGKPRPIRFKTLGKQYTPEAIQQRILYSQKTYPAEPHVRHVRLHGTYQKVRKLKGLRVFYYRELYMLGVFHRKPWHPSPAVREEIRQLDKRIEQYEFLMNRDTRTLAQLRDLRAQTEAEVRKLNAERNRLYKTNPESDQIPLFTQRLRELRKTIKLCKRIEEHSLEMYKDSWESLVGLCDEFLYLGGNEQGTHKYVSELIGKETVETTSRSLSRGRSGSSSTSHQQTARDLMTPDEVRLLSNDKALLFVRGERPVMDWKYNLLRHPNIRFTEDGGAPPYDYTVAPDAHEDLAGNAENYELLDMDDFLPAAEQPKPMFTYPRRNAHASQQD